MKSQTLPNFNVFSSKTLWTPNFFSKTLLTISLWKHDFGHFLHCTHQPGVLEKKTFFLPKPPTSEAGFETKFSKVHHQRAVLTLKRGQFKAWQLHSFACNILWKILLHLPCSVSGELITKLFFSEFNMHRVIGGDPVLLHRRVQVMDAYTRLQQDHPALPPSLHNFQVMS